MWREATRGSNDTAGDFAWAESTPFYREELARIKSVVSEATAVTPDLFYFFFQEQIFNRSHRRGVRNVCLLCNGTTALLLLCHLL